MVGVRAATVRCWRRPPRRWARGPPDPARTARTVRTGRSAASRPARAEACCGIPLDRGTAGAAAGPSPSPAVGADPALPDDSQMGAGRPDRHHVAPAGSDSPAGRSRMPTAVRVTMLVAAAVLAVAALAHVLRYVLLLINRTTLLSPLVANGSLLMGVLVQPGRNSRRHRRRSRCDGVAHHPPGRGVQAPRTAGPRPGMGPVGGVPGARRQSRLGTGLRPGADRTPSTPIRDCADRSSWWIAWIVATLISGWAIWTSGATEARAVADNTVTVVIAYLAGLAVMLLLLRVFDGFVRRPMAQRGTAPLGDRQRGCRRNCDRRRQDGTRPGRFCRC